MRKYEHLIIFHLSGNSLTFSLLYNEITFSPLTSFNNFFCSCTDTVYQHKGTRVCWNMLARKYVADLNVRHSTRDYERRLIRLAIVNLADNGHTTAVSNAIAPFGTWRCNNRSRDKKEPAEKRERERFVWDKQRRQERGKYIRFALRSAVS